MSNYSAPPSRPTPWRGKNPGQVEINALLNQITDPVVVVEPVHGLVYAVNAALLSITAFSVVELLGVSFHNLLPEIALEQISTEKDSVTVLRRHNRPEIAIKVRLSRLELSGQWVLIRLSPIQPAQQTRPVEAILQGFFDLTRIYEMDSLEAALEHAVGAVAALCTSRFAAIYRSETGDEDPRLTKTAAFESEPIFPDSLPISDLVRVTRTNVWVPGRRILIDLHLAARVCGLSYLAITPLGRKGAEWGLLVVGEKEIQPIQLIEPILNHAAALIGNVMQNEILIDTLRAQNENIKAHLNIRNMLVDNTREGIIILDPMLKVQEINTAAEWMLGFSSTDVFRKPAEDILIGPDRLMQTLEDACRGITTPSMGDVQLHTRDGRSIAVNIKVMPVTNADSVLVILILIHDESAEAEMIARTRQYEQRAVLGDVISVFAHEVRNPINSIFTGAQLLASKMPEDDLKQKIVSEIQEDCGRLTNLMDQTLNYTRAIKTLAALDLVALVKKVLDRWQPRFIKANIQPLFFKPMDNSARILGELRTLEQVFINLFSNAVEAMEKMGGGTLAVTIGPKEPPGEVAQIEVTVADTGPGISEEQMVHLFEPYHTTKPRGTGLGLSITRGFVLLNKGSIYATSPAGGAIFHLIFPAYQGEK